MEKMVKKANSVYETDKYVCNFKHFSCNISLDGADKSHIYYLKDYLESNKTTKNKDKKPTRQEDIVTTS